MLAALLVALVSGAPVLPPPPLAVESVPDEPGAVVLPDSGITLQALAADLDGDAAPEVVRLVALEGGSIDAEVWREGDEDWRLLDRLEVVPEQPTGGRADVVYTGRPVRLLLREADGADRVTLVRQPRFTEPGVGGGDDCCLLLHDLVIRDGALALVPVANPAGTVDAVFALDLDGDGTDELVTSRSILPLADVSYPTDARVYRWNGAAFAAPVVTELPVGSGDTPFVLGDSDGLPGEEIAIITTAGRPALFRVSLEKGDLLRVEDAGFVATDALAVPLGNGRGLAVIGPTFDLAVMAWPARAKPGEPEGQLLLDEGRILGVIDAADEPRLAVHETDREVLLMLGLVSLTLPAGATVTPGPAAATVGSGPLAPYVGSLPGGGPDGEPAVIYSGRLLPSAEPGGAAIGTLAGAHPIGLVGRDRGWLAILHAPLPLEPLDPAGGRLDPPTYQPTASVSLAPLELASTPEADAGVLVPETRVMTPLASGGLAVPATGFVAVVGAPAGSRIYVADPDPSVLAPGLVVPEGGQVDLVVAPPPTTANLDYRASVSVATPAGHAYVASWQVSVLVEPPELGATVFTPLGSAGVELNGRTAPFAEVTVAGEPVAVDDDGRFATTVELPPWPTEVSVVAMDPLGNEAGIRISGVGIFDYRSLPWIPISVALLGVAAAVLVLRVPRVRDSPRPASDDAVLEEIEPD